MFKKVARTKAGEVLTVDVDRIVPCPYQPRKVMNRQALEELTRSIKENGILQPLTATVTDDGKYQLIAGHRRLIAAVKAGLSAVPVVIMDKSREEVAVLAVIENLQREDLNFFEQARAIQSLMANLGLTQAGVGKKLSLSQPAVANKLKLLQFSEERQKKILSAGLTERHARALARLSPQSREKALDYVIKNNLNVAKTESYINGLLESSAAPKGKAGRKKKEIIGIRDIKIFTNTITRAVKLMQSAGIRTGYEKSEDDRYINYLITVEKKPV